MAKKGAVSGDAEKLNHMLVENFVNLQKAVTNISIKFESLSEQISKLLNLFEISAKSFSEKLAIGTPELEKDKEFLNKLDRLLDQNKVIAKGITLMEEKVRARMSPEPKPFQRFSPQGYLPSSPVKESQEE